MFTLVLFGVIFAIAAGLPRDIIDLALLKHGPTNADIVAIVEQTAQNLEGVRIPLEDIEDKIVNYNFLIELSGGLTLTDGHLSNISSFEISDDIKRLDSSTYEIPLRFKLLEFGYQYDAEISWTAHYGNVTGKIHDLEITLPLHFCGSKLNLMKVQDFKYKNIEIKFQNDSFITKFFATLTSIFEDIVIHLMKDIYAKFILNEVSEEMNNVLANKFNNV